MSKKLHIIPQLSTLVRTNENSLRCLKWAMNSSENLLKMTGIMKDYLVLKIRSPSRVKSVLLPVSLKTTTKSYLLTKNRTGKETTNIDNISSYEV